MGSVFVPKSLFSDGMNGREIKRGRTVKEAVVNHVPCEIQYTGAAHVSEYFIIKNDDNIKEAMFRGRLLKGETISLPKDLAGILRAILYN